MRGLICILHCDVITSTLTRGASRTVPENRHDLPALDLRSRFRSIILGRVPVNTTFNMVPRPTIGNRQTRLPNARQLRH